MIEVCEGFRMETIVVRVGRCSLLIPPTGSLSKFSLLIIRATESLKGTTFGIGGAEIGGTRFGVVDGAGGSGSSGLENFWANSATRSS